MSDDKACEERADGPTVTSANKRLQRSPIGTLPTTLIMLSSTILLERSCEALVRQSGILLCFLALRFYSFLLLLVI